jgi:hypothetical protein
VSRNSIGSKIATTGMSIASILFDDVDRLPPISSRGTFRLRPGFAEAGSVNGMRVSYSTASLGQVDSSNRAPGEPHQTVATKRGSQMISECFNPSCRPKLTYLRDGRVVRIIRDDPAGALRVEHFWRCGSCHLQYYFFFTDDNLPSIGPQVRASPLKMKSEIRWIEERLAS